MPGGTSTSSTSRPGRPGGPASSLTNRSKRPGSLAGTSSLVTVSCAGYQLPKSLPFALGSCLGVDRPPATRQARAGPSEPAVGARVRERASPVVGRAPPGQHEPLAQPVARAVDVVEHVAPAAVADRGRLAGVEFPVVVVVREDLEAGDPGLVRVAHAVGVEVEELRPLGRAGAQIDRLRRDVVLHLRRVGRRGARVHPDRAERVAAVRELGPEQRVEVQRRLAEPERRDRRGAAEARCRSAPGSSRPAPRRSPSPR